METSADKVDALLMVDNSLGMADKQRCWRLPFRGWSKRLTNPDRANYDQNPSDSRAEAPGAPCPAGFSREFRAIDDLHVGVVSSSLGGHGADQCSPEEGSTWNPQKNDAGHLLGSVREGLPQAGSGFLAWNPSGKLPWGDTDRAALIANSPRHVDRGR